jgi:exoribonuclease R
MDTVINATTGTIISVSFSQSRIIVARNYVYEEIELLNTPEYRQLLSVSRAISTRNTGTSSIKDSHELVAFWMTQMNRQMAIKMHDEYHTGIFRRATLLDNDVLPPEVKHWRNAVCDYVAIYGDDGISTMTTTTTLHHELMGLDKYLHITSPIRRLVDLINMTLFQIRSGVRLTAGATNFCRGWMERIDYINDRMKATRRVQTECSLLALCSSDIECDGYLYNKRDTPTTGVNIFSVYLKSLNLTYILKTIDTDVENGDTCRFKVVVFSDEDCFKRKIRLIRIK